MNAPAEGLFDDAEVISSYSRAQALEDGELVDVSERAREAGFKCPVAVTRGVWAKCVALTPKAREAGNDETGRLWDVVWMASRAIKMSPQTRDGRVTSADRVVFKVLVVIDRRRPTPVTLWAKFEPGDTAEPVVTILLEGED